jgi:hypothetical protein
MITFPGLYLLAPEEPSWAAEDSKLFDVEYVLSPGAGQTYDGGQTARRSLQLTEQGHGRSFHDAFLYLVCS